MTPPACPVCRSAEVGAFACVQNSRYWRCGRCAAAFLDPAQRPDPAAELAHYRRHRNDPADPGYRRFLARLADPLLGKLAPGSAILDYGCGPGPALARMLEEAGHRVSLFDPFFRPDATPLGTRYDAVTCTEVAEHFHEPADEFDRLALLLKPGGWLALMTCWQTDDARFANWHYRRDPTHVVFFRSSTLVHLARSRGWSIELPVKDVALMRLPP
jgi:SAM-dependent methyltransferase